MSTYIVLGVMIGIFAISLFGSGGGVRTDSHSQWAWAILFIGAVIAEIYLVSVRGHTLSNQMSWWINFGSSKIVSTIMFVFWTWLSWHFIGQPAVMAVRNLIE